MCYRILHLIYAYYRDPSAGSRKHEFTSMQNQTYWVDHKAILFGKI